MKTSKSYKLFIASMIVIVLTFVFSLLWETQGYGNNVTSLFISIAIALGLSITGLVMGIVEPRKKKVSQVWFGITGNVLIIAALASIVVYGIEKLI